MELKLSKYTDEEMAPYLYKHSKDFNNKFESSPTNIKKSVRSIMKKIKGANREKIIIYNGVGFKFIGNTYIGMRG